MIDSIQARTAILMADDRSQALSTKSSAIPTARRLFRHVALSTLGRLKRAPRSPSLRLLYLHNVFDHQVQEFEVKIKYLLTLGQFLNAQEVLQITRGNMTLDRRYFHISFDDGFRNVITNALPILRRYDIQATFFVPTSIISADRAVVENYCLNIARYPEVIDVASWEDLARAREQGLDIASHTRTHARFSEISRSRSSLEDEISGSKMDLETKLGGRCRYISWPFGRVGDADAESLAFVKQAGYEGCFGAFRGRVEPRVTDPFHLPRHHFEADWPLAHLKFFANAGFERSGS